MFIEKTPTSCGSFFVAFLYIEITFRKCSITFCLECDDGDYESEESCSDEYECHRTIWSSAPPSTEYIRSLRTREPWDDEKLCEWSDHECCERRGDIFERLPESKNPSLTFERDDLLEYCLFTCLSNRTYHHPEKHTDSSQDDTRHHRESRTYAPSYEIHDEECLHRIFP